MNTEPFEQLIGRKTKSYVFESENYCIQRRSAFKNAFLPRKNTVLSLVKKFEEKSIVSDGKETKNRSARTTENAEVAILDSEAITFKANFSKQFSIPRSSA